MFKSILIDTFNFFVQYLLLCIMALKSKKISASSMVATGRLFFIGDKLLVRRCLCYELKVRVIIIIIIIRLDLNM